MDRLIATNSVAVGDTAPATGTPQFATSGNPATNTPATDFPAYQYNALQEELMAILAAGNIAADRTKNNQVMTAVLTLLGLGNYVADTGTAGAIAIAPANPVALTAGMKVRVKVAVTNPGAATLAYNGGPQISIVGAGGALQGNELQGGYIYDFVYLPGATNYWLLIGSTKGPVSGAPATANGQAAVMGGSNAGSITFTGNASVAPATAAGHAVNLSQWTNGSGWRKTPDGYIEQWGYLAPVSVGASATLSESITYPIAFPSALYSIVLVGLTGGQGGVFAQISDATLPSLSAAIALLMNGTAATVTIGYYWYAKGK